MIFYTTWELYIYNRLNLQRSKDRQYICFHKSTIIILEYLKTLSVMMCETIRAHHLATSLAN